MMDRESPGPINRRELLIVGAVAISLGIGTIIAASRSTPIYLSVDGAHAITDARGLIGLAPRPPYYLPAFPALLLPLDRLGIAPTVNVAVWLAILVSALLAVTYSLARQCGSMRSALFGAIVASATTSLAELLGWQGGTTLLAVVAVTASFAAFLSWARVPSLRRALLVGATFTIALASHPFVAAFGAVGILGLWLELMAHRRRLDLRGTGPDGAIGLAVASLAPVLGIVLLSGWYVAIDAPVGSALRLPDPMAPIDVLAWLTRESPALTILVVLLLSVAALRRGPGRIIGIVSVLFFVLVPAFLSGDSSYQTRVAYLLPPALAVGAGGLYSAIEGWYRAAATAGDPPRRLVPLVIPITLAIWAVSLGFPQRLAVAVPYYSTLSASDYTLIEGMSGQAGSIATGWIGNRYWDGLLNAWFVEGIADRAAFGPTDPALTTRALERTQAAAAWQLFSGAAGVENGAVQMSVGPPGWRADPAVSASIGGTYVPMIFLSDTSNDYGGTAEETIPLAWRIRDRGADSVEGTTDHVASFGLSADLAGRVVTTRWTRDRSQMQSAWTIWVWPAYGLPWARVTGSGNHLVLRPSGLNAVRDPIVFDTRGVNIALTASAGSSMSYVGSEQRYHVQAVAIDVPADQDLELRIEIEGTDPADVVTKFDERSLIALDNVTGVLVWRDSGWADRFSSSRCFAPGRSNSRIAGFDVVDACRGKSP